MGISNTIGTIPGIISPMVTGYIVQDRVNEQFLNCIQYQYDKQLVLWNWPIKYKFEKSILRGSERLHDLYIASFSLINLLKLIFRLLRNGSSCSSWLRASICLAQSSTPWPRPANDRSGRNLFPTKRATYVIQFEVLMGDYSLCRESICQKQ